ncbi:hypothetical protein L1987_78832 [Smallanthus sonchifolius]|uniref:Uncharacterized protein n=1 Tax=Smallanthus sonchifolius TaxID=185202 RepID=A0ACB8ZI80_9ASTR|nr:hypothetical protein L1987_78832 [Smallanthus sonchifolius]
MNLRIAGLGNPIEEWKLSTNSEIYTPMYSSPSDSSAPPQPAIQSTPHPPSRSIDINDMIPSEDEEILYGSKSSSNLKSDQNLNLNKRDGVAVMAADSGGRVFEEDLFFAEDVNKSEFSQNKD